MKKMVSYYDLLKGKVKQAKAKRKNWRRLAEQPGPSSLKKGLKEVDLVISPQERRYLKNMNIEVYEDEKFQKRKLLELSELMKAELIRIKQQDSFRADPNTSVVSERGAPGRAKNGISAQEEAKKRLNQTIEGRVRGLGAARKRKAAGSQRRSRGARKESSSRKKNIGMLRRNVSIERELELKVEEIIQDLASLRLSGSDKSEDEPSDGGGRQERSRRDYRGHQDEISGHDDPSDPKKFILMRNQNASVKTFGGDSRQLVVLSRSAGSRASSSGGYKSSKDSAGEPQTKNQKTDCRAGLGARKGKRKGSPTSGYSSSSRTRRLGGSRSRYFSGSNKKLIALNQDDPQLKTTGSRIRATRNHPGTLSKHRNAKLSARNLQKSKKRLLSSKRSRKQIGGQSSHRTLNNSHLSAQGTHQGHKSSCKIDRVSKNRAGSSTKLYHLNTDKKIKHRAFDYQKYDFHERKSKEIRRLQYIADLKLRSIKKANSKKFKKSKISSRSNTIETTSEVIRMAKNVIEAKDANETLTASYLDEIKDLDLTNENSINSFIQLAEKLGREKISQGSKLKCIIDLKNLLETELSRMSIFNQKLKKTTPNESHTVWIELNRSQASFSASPKPPKMTRAQMSCLNGFKVNQSDKDLLEVREGDSVRIMVEPNAPNSLEVSQESSIHNNSKISIQIGDSKERECVIEGIITRPQDGEDCCDCVVQTDSGDRFKILISERSFCVDEQPREEIPECYREQGQGVIVVGRGSGKESFLGVGDELGARKSGGRLRRSFEKASLLDEEENAELDLGVDQRAGDRLVEREIGSRVEVVDFGKAEFEKKERSLEAGVDLPTNRINSSFKDDYMDNNRSQGSKVKKGVEKRSQKRPKEASKVQKVANNSFSLQSPKSPEIDSIQFKSQQMHPKSSNPPKYSPNCMLYTQDGYFLAEGCSQLKIASDNIGLNYTKALMIDQENNTLFILIRPIGKSKSFRKGGSVEILISGSKRVITDIRKLTTTETDSEKPLKVSVLTLKRFLTPNSPNVKMSFGGKNQANEGFRGQNEPTEGNFSNFSPIVYVLSDFKFFGSSEFLGGHQITVALPKYIIESDSKLRRLFQHETEASNPKNQLLVLDAEMVDEGNSGGSEAPEALRANGFNIRVPVGPKNNHWERFWVVMKSKFGNPETADIDQILSKAAKRGMTLIHHEVVITRLLVQTEELVKNKIYERWIKEFENEENDEESGHQEQKKDTVEADSGHRKVNQFSVGQIVDKKEEKVIEQKIHKKQQIVPNIVMRENRDYDEDVERSTELLVKPRKHPKSPKPLQEEIPMKNPKKTKKRTKKAKKTETGATRHHTQHKDNFYFTSQHRKSPLARVRRKKRSRKIEKVIHEIVANGIKIKQEIVTKELILPEDTSQVHEEASQAIEEASFTAPSQLTPRLTDEEIGAKTPRSVGFRAPLRSTSPNQLLAEMRKRSTAKIVNRKNIKVEGPERIKNSPQRPLANSKRLIRDMEELLKESTAFPKKSGKVGVEDSPVKIYDSRRSSRRDGRPMGWTYSSESLEDRSRSQKTGENRYNSRYERSGEESIESAKNWQKLGPGGRGKSRSDLESMQELSGFENRVSFGGPSMTQNRTPEHSNSPSRAIRDARRGKKDEKAVKSSHRRTKNIIVKETRIRDYVRQECGDGYYDELEDFVQIETPLDRREFDQVMEKEPKKSFSLESSKKEVLGEEMAQRFKEFYKVSLKAANYTPRKHYFHLDQL